MPSLELMGQVSRDPHLLERLTSAAAEAGIEHAEAWVAMNARRLVSAQCDPADPAATVARIWEYQLGWRASNPVQDTHLMYVPLGLDLNGISDDHLRHAVQTVTAATP